ncbi:hypothetical protein O181_071472 [Austropuccinia psidii MF-1]|uniref:Uncharacterized protein n=1 Tax=Austropuccinia psidii MF-1 TaxID=1389203 RepID=A0A9Q3F586_9BASI|nr:hypothetical protein [Austropuccinia psidii MF-1]
MTESSPSVRPPSVLCGYGIFSWVGSPWSMPSSGHFDPSPIYDGYKAVEVLYPAFTELLRKARQFFQQYNPRSYKCHHCFVGKKPCQHPGMPLYNIKQYLWRKKEGPFGKEFPVSEAPTPDGTSGHSNCKYCGLLGLILFLCLALMNGSRKRDGERWTTGGRPIYSGSEAPISRIKNQGVVKQIRRITDSPTDMDSEGSDKLDGEVEVVKPLIDHH